MRPQLLGTTGSLEVIAEAGGYDIARVLSGAEMGSGIIVVEAFSDERLSCTVSDVPDGNTLEIRNLSFDDTVALLGAIGERVGASLVRVLEYNEAHALFRVDAHADWAGIVAWLEGEEKPELTVSLVSQTTSSAMFDAVAE